MQSLKQDRIARPEVCDEVWCVKSKVQGHDKDHIEVLMNYLTGRGPIPLRPKAQEGPSVTPALWYAICQIGGNHAMNNCHMLQKYT